MDDTYHGKWWTPTYPTCHLSGILRIIPGEGAHLELGEILQSSVSEGLVEYKLIFGKLDNGTDITLLNGTEIFRSSGEPQTSTILVNYVMDGAPMTGKDRTEKVYAHMFQIPPLF